MPEDELERLRGKIKLVGRTRNTITSWDKLEEQLRQIRRQGIAFDHEEFMIGICAVGAAFRGPGDEIGVFSMPTPTDRFVKAEKNMARILLERCKVLQRRLQR